MRNHLTAELAKKVSQKGIVVWQDADHEYSDVADSLCPPDSRFVAYKGSWYALRREVEPLLSGDAPPKLVVYAPARAPSEDPLEELRAAGCTYTLRLSTLAKNALKGQLSEQRLAEIGSKARTLLEAETAAGGDAGGDVRLISVLGASDGRTMALHVLTGERAAELEGGAAWAAAAELLSAQVGGTLTGSGDELRRAGLRQMVLTAVAGSKDPLPKALASAWGPVSAEQRRRTTDLLTAWQGDPRYRDDYGSLAREIDEELGLRSTLKWTNQLANCIATPAIEEVVFTEAVRLLGAGDATAAGILAEGRLRISPWVQPQGPSGEDWATTARKWRAVQATADLLIAVGDSRPPKLSDSAALLDWYVQIGWKVDRAHRRFEVARNDLRILGVLEPPFTAARGVYDQWLDSTLLAFTTAIEKSGFDAGSHVRQGDIHAKWVRDAAGPVAYVWVDALRYELGIDLREGLRADGHTVDLHAAVAAVPTITPVGMANLTPAAGAGLTLELDGGDLIIRVSGAKVANVSDRVARLRAAHGDKVLDRTLDSVAGQGEKELKRSVGDANLLLVRSQELDSAGESGMLNAAWSQFNAVLELLRNLVARLGQAGVRRIVITADHGFVTLSRGLGPDRAIDPPAGGTGDLHRRGWIGKGASTTPSTLRVAVASTGIPSDLDVIVPRGLAVFRAGGSKQFFHGGLSPQELLIPVIVVDTQPAPAPKELAVEISIAGGRITTGAFAATVGFSGNLFTTEITVRVVAQGPTGSGVVARVVSGDGFDPATGAVTLRADGTPPVLTFQVTANLERDTAVDIEVFDARTGVRLGGTEATVSAKIVVEDDLE
ncbi:MAG: PglZ domain-containing protein [Candidatus Dormibacteraeota bacterium]|nr:PglZ domain-containing protein [Candidatus Dormibacteraeota bacterium]